jgi:hypothetical protein
MRPIRREALPKRWTLLICSSEHVSQVKPEPGEPLLASAPSPSWLAVAVAELAILEGASEGPYLD